MNENETDRLARWYNELNHWGWAEDMPGKPEGFDLFPNILKGGEEFRANKYDWIEGIMRGIEERIGHKETLRWHHIHNLNRTNQEFEEWWKRRGIP